MADLQPNPDYYLPPRPKMPTYAPAELRAGEISEMPPWYRRPLGATADSVRAFGRMFGYDDFDKRTADTLDIASLASLGASGLAAARRGVDANIARTLEQYVPAESFRGLFAPGVTKWWGDAIAPGPAFPKSARHPNPPSLLQNELSWLPRVEPGRADKFMLPSRAVPDYRAGYLDELAKLKSNDNVLSATQAAERALARNPNDERAKYMLAAERQREAQRASEHADKVRRFERALDPDPRSHLSVIDGGLKAYGGAVDPIANALRVALQNITDRQQVAANSDVAPHYSYMVGATMDSKTGKTLEDLTTESGRLEQDRTESLSRRILQGRPQPYQPGVTDNYGYRFPLPDIKGKTDYYPEPSPKDAPPYGWRR